LLLITFRLPYKVEKIDISKNTQKEPWFLEINPNGRIPALTDTFTDGKTIRLFESGSIMQYLIAQYDKDHKISFPEGTREFYETNNWLFFLNAGVGPMQVSGTSSTNHSAMTNKQTRAKPITSAGTLPSASSTASTGT